MQWRTVGEELAALIVDITRWIANFLVGLDENSVLGSVYGQIVQIEL